MPGREADGVVCMAVGGVVFLTLVTVLAALFVAFHVDWPGFLLMVPCYWIARDLAEGLRRRLQVADLEMGLREGALD